VGSGRGDGEGGQVLTRTDTKGKVKSRAWGNASLLILLRLEKRHNLLIPRTSAAKPFI
jgi:hypothetical protein